jgi:hypothetical protein
MVDDKNIANFYKLKEQDESKTEKLKTQNLLIQCIALT